MVFPFSWLKKKNRQSAGGAGRPPWPPPQPPVKKSGTDQFTCPRPPVQDDTVVISLPGITISLTRKLELDVPHEVSIIIPRAELRFREQETDLIYNSVTVVHAPRHPPAGEMPPGVGGPGVFPVSTPPPVYGSGDIIVAGT